MSESSSDEDINLTPEELQAVDNAEFSFLPEKSRGKYIKVYNLFNAWRHSKGAKTLSETIMLSYFVELSKTRKSSTLWSIFSMLKATIKTKNDIQIEKYSKLLEFIKKKSSGHKPKKSKIFTHANIEQFLNEAPDSEFLATKVVLIVGISGACRANELTFLRTKNIEKHSEKLLLVNLSNRNTNFDRNFVIRDEYVKIVEKYQALRPANTRIDRFFLQYRNGKCFRQPMGCTKIGGMPREIATFLGLQEPKQYTGHCFRRTSASLLADSGADLTMLKRHSNCKSSTVTEGHIEDSIENETEICKGIIGAADAPARTVHTGISCNECQGDVVGFRYTCVECSDFDLCASCEAGGAHAQHYVLRIPKHRPHREIQKWLEKIRNQLESGDESTQEETESTYLDPESIKIEIKEEVLPEPDPLYVTSVEIKTEPLEYPEESLTQSSDKQDSGIQTPSVASEPVNTSKKRRAPQTPNKPAPKKAKETQVLPNRKVVEVRSYSGPSSADSPLVALPSTPSEAPRSTAGFVSEAFTHHTKEEPPDSDD